MTSSLLVISDPSAAQEELAAWLVVVVGLLQMWNLLSAFLLSGICLLIFYFGRKVGQEQLLN